MSGHVPEWIQKGKPVLYRGKPHIVKSWFFTSTGDGCHNSDVFNLLLKGVKGAVQYPDFKQMGAPRNPIDKDVQAMSIRKAQREIMRLRKAIRNHKDAKDNARCWMNDFELYRVLPEKTFSLPIRLPECEFLKNCREYFRRQKRRKG